MEKLKFEFTVKSSTEDPKTNIIAITSITTPDDRCFILPDQLQPMRYHAKLTTTAGYQKIKATLQKRGQARKVWISLAGDILQQYKDEDGNIICNDYLLEEMSTAQDTTPTPNITEETLSRILEKFTEKKTEDKPQDYGIRNLRKVSEKFVIEKLTGKNSNVPQWMDIFENECSRLGVERDIEKIEIFRLFLEDSCIDWYGSMLIKYTLDSEWRTWKQNFCETYANKGWTGIRYAISYKYIKGSLLEYALKKERLLSETNKSIDTPTLIDLIAVGLPNFVSDSIDREKLNQTEDIFKEIRGLEHLVNKKNSEKKSTTTTTYIENKSKAKNSDHKPCSICEKKNKSNRYHPESLCWFRNKADDQQNKEYIRHVNNSGLEIELNTKDPKNL
ncbi:uncharacterized protein [Neodiprion pinetum]|uniref:uncharacterized protein n=1 Tax=Neodiprion pinetum TaxID=441929 RepID=UPI00371454C4